VLAQYFEAAGFATVLVGFVREHIEFLKPPRALWLKFPMGRPVGIPGDAGFQKRVIRTALDLLDKPDGPQLEPFPEIIPVRDGRMSYALPADLVLRRQEVGDIEALLEDVQQEITALLPEYRTAVAARGRTTVGASTLPISELAPYIAQFMQATKPKSPVAGLSAVPLLKLVAEDLTATSTETQTHRDAADNFEITGEWFWRETRAGHLLLALEAVCLESDDRVLQQMIELAMLTPRFWFDGPLPG